MKLQTKLIKKKDKYRIELKNYESTAVKSALICAQLNELKGDKIYLENFQRKWIGEIDRQQVKQD